MRHPMPPAYYSGLSIPLQKITAGEPRTPPAKIITRHCGSPACLQTYLISSHTRIAGFPGQTSRSVSGQVEGLVLTRSIRAWPASEMQRVFTVLLGPLLARCPLQRSRPCNTSGKQKTLKPAWLNLHRQPAYFGTTVTTGIRLLGAGRKERRQK